MPEVSENQGKINWKTVLIAVVIGAILVGLGVAVYLLLQPKPTPTTQVTTKQSTPSAKISTPSAKKDETAGWKPYKTNRKHASNFEIKYPTNWTLDVGPELWFHPKNGEGYPYIRVSGGTGYSADALYNSWKGGIDSNLNEGLIKVANKEAKVLSGTINEETKNIKTIYVLLELDDKDEVYYFNLVYESGVKDKQIEDIFNNMLSTFRFD